jgi:TM2 domain-containing membrane protein YozV
MYQVKNEVLESLDSSLANSLGKCTDQNKVHQFERLFLDGKKSTVIAVLLSFLYCHRFYYGQIGMNILFWIVAICTAGIGGVIWWIYDLCTMSKRTRAYNYNLALDAMRKVDM